MVEVRVAAAADLPQAGDAGLHRQPAAVPQVVARDLVGERRPRADEAHLAAEHVPQLGQLVERGPPQEAADPRDARVVVELEHRAAELVAIGELGPPRLGVGDHRAELDDRERAPVEADPRSGGTGSAGRRRAAIAIAMASRIGDRSTRPTRGAEEVERALRGQGERPVRARDEREDRRAVELLDPARGDRAVHDVHRDPDDLALLLAQAGDRVDAVPQREREADRDLVDDVVWRTVSRSSSEPEERPPVAGCDVGFVVEEADDAEAELAMALELGRERLRRAARRPSTSTNRRLRPSPAIALQDAPQDARGRRSSAAAWAGNRTSRRRRLTSGRWNRNRTLSVTSAITTVARTTSTASLRSVQRARGRYRPFERQDGDPGRRVEHEERHRLGHDLAPPVRPSRVRSARTESATSRPTASEGVGGDQEGAEPEARAVGSCRGQYGGVVRAGNGTDGLAPPMGLQSR